MAKKPKKSKAKPKKQKKKPLLNKVGGYAWLEVEPEELPEAVMETSEGRKELVFVDEKPKPIPDDIRFVDPMEGCTFPQQFEFFNKGKSCQATIEDKLVFECEDTGSGFQYREHGRSTWKFIDYAAMGDLLKAVRVMHVMQESRIFSDTWYTDHKGRVCSFNNLLQNISEEFNNKKGGRE